MSPVTTPGVWRATTEQSQVSGVRRAEVAG